MKINLCIIVKAKVLFLLISNVVGILLNSTCKINQQLVASLVFGNDKRNYKQTKIIGKKNR